MHRFLSLLTFLALLMAPLAAPAAAMAPVPVAADCADMAAPDHQMPAGDHGTGEACCIAVPPAIDPPQPAVAIVAEIDHLAFIAANAPFRLGAGPKAEDPPPRIA